MMWLPTKSEAAFRLSYRKLAAENRELYFWTFTAERIESDKEFARSWHRFSKRLKRIAGQGFCALRVFEPHYGGGERDGRIHCHMVCNRWLDVDALRKAALGTGIGQVMHVRQVDGGTEDYLVKYLQKSWRGKECRVWDAIGEWDHSRVRDIEVNSIEADFYRACYKITGDWNLTRVLAEHKRSKIIGKMERQAAGILPPDAVLEGAAQPILTLIGAFVADCASRGRSKNTQRLYGHQIANVCRECGFVYLRDVTRGGFEGWRIRAQQGERSASKFEAKKDREPSRTTGEPHNAVASRRLVPGRLSGKSINDTLGYLRTFLGWCERRGFIEVNPLRHVEKVQIRADRGYRRALSATELAAFFETVPRHRAAVYAAAYFAGLRRHELKRLKRGDFQLDGLNPCVRVPGIAAKNGKAQAVPLHQSLVSILRGYWAADMAPFAWAFRGHVPNMETWHRDLVRAGVPYLDGEGRRFDFHALRHTLCTHLREARVGLRDAMTIMRHSDPRLTLRVYTDERQISVSSEVAKLPPIPTFERAQIRAQTAVVSGLFIGKWGHGARNGLPCPR